MWGFFAEHIDKLGDGFEGVFGFDYHWIWFYVNSTVSYGVFFFQLGMQQFLNMLFSPVLYFVYPYLGVSLLFDNDNDKEARKKMDEGSTGSIMDMIYYWTHLFSYLGVWIASGFNIHKVINKAVD